MAIKKDIKHVIRDIMGTGGGIVRLEEGQSYGDFLKNKNHGKTNKAKNIQRRAGETPEVVKD